MEGHRVWKDLGERKNLIKIYLNIKIALNNKNIIKINKYILGPRERQTDRKMKDINEHTFEYLCIGICRVDLRGKNFREWEHCHSMGDGSRLNRKGPKEKVKEVLVFLFLCFCLGSWNNHPFSLHHSGLYPLPPSLPLTASSQIFNLINNRNS